MRATLAVLVGALAWAAWGGDVVPTPDGDTRARMTETKLAEIVVPKIDFENADLAQVLAFLRKRSTELDPQGEGVNFVLRQPEPSPKVSLTLSNVTLGVTLRMVTMLTDTEYEVDENVVIVRPKGELHHRAPAHDPPPAPAHGAPAHDPPPAAR